MIAKRYHCCHLPIIWTFSVSHSPRRKGAEVVITGTREPGACALVSQEGVVVT